MGAFLTYLRQHPWQRRMMTALAAMLIGLAAAFYAMPYVRQYYRDRQLLAGLANPDAKDRLIAVYKAIRAAKDNPVTLDRLRKSLDTPDDRQFAAVARVLRELGKFDLAARPELLDRLLAVNFETTQSPDSRRIILMPALLSDRDNAYIRRTLMSAAADPSPEVRAMAATLAAKLGDDQTLDKLLVDSEANVAATAALDAGIAGRKSAQPALQRLLLSPQVDVFSSEAYGLMCLDWPVCVQIICDVIEQIPDGKLRARLLYVVAVGGGDVADKTMMNLVRRAEEQGGLLSAAELIACGRRHLADAEAPIRKVLQAAGRKDPSVTVGQALAAIDAAGNMQLPVRAEMFEICKNLWDPAGDFVTLLEHAARELGRQAALPQPGRGDEPTREECVKLLQQLVMFSVEASATSPASAAAIASSAATAASAGTTTAAAPAELTTPVPSAAAVVALWELDAPLADEFVKHACTDEKLLAGDTVAWGLATGPRKDKAFDLGLTMLPEIGGREKVYFENERSAGAMLLALSARTDQQKKTARTRIAPRLAGDEPDFAVKGSYRCAMLILGDSSVLDDTRILLETGFPRRRVLTALLCAGDKQALDWLLANPQLSTEQIARTLVLWGVQDVIAAAAPSLPQIDPGADDDLQAWQVRILRQWYVIHRQNLKLQYYP